MAAENDDEEVPFPAARYPLADPSPAVFEGFVAELFSSAGQGLERFRVTPHEVINAADGTYDFDATVRFRFLGMDFLIVVEAKRHSNPIKRDVVQVLRQKQLSVGAHKAVVISTAKFQSGAIRLAKTQGIALATMIEGRFLFETRAARAPALTPEQAAAYGLPPFVGMCAEPGEEQNSWRMTYLTVGDSARLREILLGVT